MPFADELAKKEPDVISVHHGSYLFQGFFGEARQALAELGCDAYVIVGDDLILNVKLDEKNIHAKMNLPERHAYIKNLSSLYDSPISLSRNRTTYRAFFPDGFKWESSLPKSREAFERSGKYPISHKPLGFRNFPLPWTRAGLSSLATAASWFLSRDHSRKLFSHTCKTVSYPAFYSYSDFLIIPGREWVTFAKYCEATTAMQLFVEAAIPLAMVLACSRVETEYEYGEKHDSISPRRRMRMRGVELPWQGAARQRFEESFSRNFDKLVDGFDSETLYYHPVKLSSWSTGRYVG